MIVKANNPNSIRVFWNKAGWFSIWVLWAVMTSMRRMAAMAPTIRKGSATSLCDSSESVTV